MEKKTFKIEGLTCIDCAGRIQASVGALPGIGDCRVDLSTGNLTVWLETPELEVQPIARVVQDTGHKLITERRRGPQGNGAARFFRFLTSRRETVMTLTAGLLTVVGGALAVAGAPEMAWVTLFALAIVVGGAAVARNAYQELRFGRSLGINTLMVVAVTGAVVIDQWAEAAIVVVLFALGEALEGYAAEQARGALESLLDLVPPTALRLNSDGQFAEAPVAQIAVGDRVLVRPGDRISVDGVVQAGQSAVDQAAITGESVPVDKAPGDELFAGTVNTSAALEVTVTRLASDTTLARMITLVQEAQTRQAPVQRFVERFARIYTPVVALCALLVAALPPLLFQQPFLGETGWLLRALELLVIACPCALVISTPVSVVSALTNAASRGVLIKGGRYLEALGQVRVFAFDKTGTLTEGRPATTDVVDVCARPAPGHNGLGYAAAVEAQSSHPLARALVAEAQAQRIAIRPAQEVAVLSGRGMTGVVDGARVTVGSHPYFDATFPHPSEVCQEASRLTDEGKTVMMVGHDDQVCSVVAVADTPRADSRTALAELKTLRDVRTVMLTGDSLPVAQAIGREVGIDDVRAGLLPADKVAAVAELSAGGQAVAMVGDGVNDAPALARATVGIAMGGASSAQAMEAADVVLMGDSLRELPFIVRLSRRTRAVVRANIVLALGVKAIVFGLALAGLASLWMAVVADVGASMLVILNGMRLRHNGPFARAAVESVTLP